MKYTGVCKLCNKTCELKKSHIIPRLAVKLIRDENLKNRFYKLFNKQSKIIQDVPKEYLLCYKCEQHFGNNYEKYFKETIHLSRQRVEIIQNNNIVTIRNLDYGKIKLFLLSVLWRMSISSLTWFTNLSLGNDEDIIRKMILEEKPRRSEEYPIAAVIPLIEGNMKEQWTSTSFVSDRTDQAKYAMIIGGILYFFYMKQQNNCFLPKFQLNESGNWHMQLVDLYNIPFLKEFFESINRS
ncbi:MAG: hypothetical protein JW787_02895 [Sedimentisphaerales bacterium]|nr:hypothetical protein [Sedimentisphaerales bacterium]